MSSRLYSKTNLVAALKAIGFDDEELENLTVSKKMDSAFKLLAMYHNGKIMSLKSTKFPETSCHALEYFCSYLAW